MYASFTPSGRFVHTWALTANSPAGAGSSEAECWCATLSTKNVFDGMAPLLPHFAIEWGWQGSGAFGPFPAGAETSQRCRQGEFSAHCARSHETPREVG